MTIHFISVGVSIRDEFLHHSNRVRDTVDRDLHTAVAARKDQLFPQIGLDEFSTWLTNALSSPDHDARAVLDRLVAAVQPARWPARASAELDTLAASNSAPGPARVGDDDIALLVSTDTVPGLQSALWNALALTSGAVERVRYLPEPGPSLRQTRGHAVIARVPGLDAGTEQGFRTAMGGLGRLGRAAVDAADQNHEEEFVFHLSGGFKAAIPYLIGLAEGVKSMDVGPVRAQALHEITQDRRPIRLPLRSLPHALVHSELGGADEHGFLPPPTGGFQALLGYAYELDRVTGRYRLTSFGHGLRALFGLEEER